MKQKVIKIGSSAAITVSPESLQSLGIKIGDTVETTSSPEGFIVKPSVPRGTSAVDPQILQWGAEFITKNRELLLRLKDK